MVSTSFTCHSKAAQRLWLPLVLHIDDPVSRARNRSPDLKGGCATAGLPL
jgi:hypothetical protein